ncbi:hypothetical protein [Breznakibacter xylanolyticus]|nr:hypothetical protein [Breznakibacter xylanolyticus]
MRHLWLGGAWIHNDRFDSQSRLAKSADPQVYPFCIGFSFLPDWM